MRTRAILVCIALAVAMAASGTTAVTADPGFTTGEDPMLTAVMGGVTVEELLTVGEELPGTDYQFEAIPDGISVRLGAGGQIRST